MTTTGVAGIAALFAEPSRAAMVELLLDGREHSVQELARAGGVALSTASEHLGRLESGGVVVSRRAGRERLARLAGRVAAPEKKGRPGLSGARPVKGLREWNRREELRGA